MTFFSQVAFCLSSAGRRGFKIGIVSADVLISGFKNARAAIQVIIEIKTRYNATAGGSKNQEHRTHGNEEYKFYEILCYSSAYEGLAFIQ